MERNNKLLISILSLVALAVLLAVGFAVSWSHDETADSWTAGVEGFLAVPTPCCTKASLWSSLDEVSADGQQARPATAAEAARWLDQWPYRSRDERDAASREEALQISAQSSEVKCIGSPTGPSIPARLPDEDILKAIRNRHECTYARWKVWSGRTAQERPNERHTVWVDEAGFFHGRVDYWR